MTSEQAKDISVQILVHVEKKSWPGALADALDAAYLQGQTDKTDQILAAYFRDESIVDLPMLEWNSKKSE